MQIWEFVRELAFFFPLSGTEEHKNKIFDSYVENLEGIVISNKCEYDWAKVLKAIQRTHAFSKFPSLAEIIKCLPEGKITKPYQECEGEGSLVVMTLPSGRKYTFTVSAIGRPIGVIKDEITKKYGGCKVEIYPAGAVMVGNEIIY